MGRKENKTQIAYMVKLMLDSQNSCKPNFQKICRDNCINKNGYNLMRHIWVKYERFFTTKICFKSEIDKNQFLVYLEKLSVTDIENLLQNKIQLENSK